LRLINLIKQKSKPISFQPVKKHGGALYVDEIAKDDCEDATQGTKMYKLLLGSLLSLRGLSTCSHY